VNDDLEINGYVVLENFIDDELLAALNARLEEIFEREGAMAGSEFKQEAGCRRLANLVDKGAVFERVICHPRLLPYVEAVLGPDFKLSSLNARRVNPHADVTQPLHADMAAVADEQGDWVCNSVWMLDDITPENGAIRVIPGSHRWNRLPADALDDPRAAHPGQTLITGKAGTVVVMNAHAWHGGLPNRIGRPRTALHAFYARRDKPQQQYQKQLIRPSVQASLSPQARHILALDDPLNHRLSADVPVRSGFLK